MAAKINDKKLQGLLNELCKEIKNTKKSELKLTRTEKEYYFSAFLEGIRCQVFVRKSAIEK